MTDLLHLPYPVLDALPLGAHRLSALTDQALFEACGVRVAFTGRAGGVSEGPYASLNTADHVGDDLAHVERNRRIVCEAAGADAAPLIVPNQVHSTDFVRVRTPADSQAAIERVRDGIDGVVVDCAGVAALLNAGDCLLLAIVSPTGRFVVAHAGWRGAVAGVAGKAVALLAQQDSAQPADYNAYLGPHIRQECFEVGPEVEQVFRERFGEDAIASPRHVSLARAVTIDLVRAGMQERRVADSGICTVCNHNDYFSYRAEGGVCGRHAAFAFRAEER